MEVKVAVSTAPILEEREQLAEDWHRYKATAHDAQA
jgi:hypothetical protein